MVMMEKSEEGKSTKRSIMDARHSDEDSATDDSDSGKSDGGMRVGSMFQAQVPELKAELPMAGKADGHDAILIWAPHQDLTDARIDEYIHISKEKHGYNTEQALGMLFWHKHNVDKALADLPNFTPFPDEWSVEDKVLFEQAFSFHGKSFHRIRQMLPDKSMASLVRYYYSWKKTRSRTSMMDRQAKKLASHVEDDSDGESEGGSGNNDSDFDQTAKENGKTEEGKSPCSNCGMNASQLHSTPKGSLCNSCYQYWRRTGVMRSNIGPLKKLDHSNHSGRHNPMKNKRKPPRGMYLNQDDVISMQTGPSGQAEAILKQLDAEVITLKHQVRNNKQTLSNGKQTIVQGIDACRPPETATRINPRWTNEELLLAVQGVRKYGKDFKAVAELIGNKTEAHVRSFFVNYRRRYNLDEVLAEYEAEYGPDETKVLEKKQVDKERSMDNVVVSGDPLGGGEGVGSNGVPALKQSTSPHKQHQRLLPPSHRSTIQQPPPLIKPSAAPVAHSKPQLAGQS